MKIGKPVGDLLQNPALANIGSTLALHRRTLQAIRKALPDFLAVHCQDCVVKPDRLIIYCDSALFASQLRFYVPQLQQRLASEQALPFREIQVRNLITATRPSPKPRPATLPSPDIIAMLKANGEGDPASDLGSAWLKLSETLKQQSPST